MDNRRRMLLSGGGFPAEPTDYELISRYTASGTFTAPEDGWFQVEVFGASGAGYKCIWSVPSGSSIGTAKLGGGGGGGGYSCSRVKLKKGDTIILDVGTVGNTSSAIINSSLKAYSDLSVVNGYSGSGQSGGLGGKASGGNYANVNGKNGGNGSSVKWSTSTYNKTYYGGASGAAGFTGGNAGGRGGGAELTSNSKVANLIAPGSGKAGFIKIYRGNTN